MTYARWSRVPNSLNLVGAQVARYLLDANGLRQNPVQMQPGSLTDHYDPRKKTVALSEKIYREPSVASAAIAAHETGHAVQDKTGYSWMRFRYMMSPVVQLGAQYGPYAVSAGFLFGQSELVVIGFVGFAATLLFQILTLPVEFDASRRAKDMLYEMGFTTKQDQEGARRVLRAAAMTYVAGAATAMGKLLVMLLIAGRWLLKRAVPRSVKP